MLAWRPAACSLLSSSQARDKRYWPHVQSKGMPRRQRPHITTARTTATSHASLGLRWRPTHICLCSCGLHSAWPHLSGPLARHPCEAFGNCVAVGLTDVRPPPIDGRRLWGQAAATLLTIGMRCQPKLLRPCANSPVTKNLRGLRPRTPSKESLLAGPIWLTPRRADNGVLSRKAYVCHASQDWWERTFAALPGRLKDGPYTIPTRYAQRPSGCGAAGVVGCTWALQPCTVLFLFVFL